MFENTDAPDNVTQRPGGVEGLPVARAAQPATVIAADVALKGELTAGTEVIIHGQFEGSIARNTKTVIVGKAGRVKALIHADKVIVRGLVEGDIYVDEVVELIDGSKVDGNIFCSCIKVEKGARFNGAVTMS